MSDGHGAPGLPNETRINTLGVTVAVVATIVVVPILMLGVYFYLQFEIAREVESKIALQPTTELNEARAEWDSQRNAYGVVDKASGRYQIPVDEARALFIEDAREAREAAIAAAKLAEEEAAALEAEGEMLEGSGDELKAGKEASGGAE